MIVIAMMLSFLDRKCRFRYSGESDTDEGNQLLLLETGYRNPLRTLICDDKAAIKTAISDYHTLVKIKPEIDQFANGLKVLNVLECMKYPSMMAPLFVDEGDAYLNKGK